MTFTTIAQYKGGIVIPKLKPPMQPKMVLVVFVNEDGNKKLEETYANPLSKEEIKDIKKALQNIKTGKYTTITDSDRLKAHLDALKA